MMRKLILIIILLLFASPAMGDVTFVAAGAIAANSTVATQAIVAPACAANDILIAVVINKALTNTIQAPDGTWTQIYQAAGDCSTLVDDHRAAIFWKLATGSGGSFTFTKTTDDNVLFGGAITAWRGANTTSPLDATAVASQVNAAAADNVTFPAFDPTTTMSHILFVAVYGNDATTFAAAMSSDVNPDCTTRLDVESPTGNDVSIAITAGNTTDGSNIASRTWASASSADAGSTGVVFGLKPANDTHYWQSTAGNWSGPSTNWWATYGGIPIAGDNVQFDVNSTANCTIDVNTPSLNWLDTDAYTYTITQSANVTTTGDLSLKQGTWTASAGAYTITVGGWLNIGNDDAESATVNLASSTGAIAITGAVNFQATAAGVATLTLGNQTLSFGANWDSADANADFNCGTSTVISTPSSDQSVKSKDSNPFYKFSKTGASNIWMDTNIIVNNNFTVSSGVFNQNGGVGGWKLTVGGTFLINGTGTFVKSTANLGLVLNGGVAQNFTSRGQDMGNVQISIASTNVSLLDSLDCDNLTIDASTTLGTASSMDVAGNIANAGTINQTAGTTVMSGASKSISGSNTATTFYNLQISGTPVTLSQSATVSATLTTDLSKNLQLDAIILTIGEGGTITNSGGIVVNTTGPTIQGTAGGAAETITGTDIDYNGKSITLKTIDYQIDTALGAGEILVIGDGNCIFDAITVTAGTLDDSGNHTFTASGNWGISGTGTFISGASWVNLSGTGKNITTTSSNSDAFYSLDVSGSYALLSNIDLGQHMKISSTGTLDASNKTITLTGIGGNFDVDGTFTYNASKVVMEATAEIQSEAGWKAQFYDLTIGKVAATPTVTIAATSQWEGAKVYHTLTILLGAILTSNAERKVQMQNGSEIVNSGICSPAEVEFDLGSSSGTAIMGGGNYTGADIQIMRGIVTLGGNVTASDDWRIGHWQSNSTGVLNLDGKDIIASGSFTLGRSGSSTEVGQVTTGLGDITALNLYINETINGLDYCSLTVESGSTCVFSGEVFVHENGIITNNSSIACANFTNEASGTYTANTAGCSLSCANFINDGTFTNTAVNTISASGHVTISAFGATTTNNTLTMTGNGKYINSSVHLGNLVNNGGTVGSGNYIDGNNLILDGTFTNNSGKYFNTLDDDGITSRDLTTGGTIDIDGPIYANASTITITGDGNFDIDGQNNFSTGESTVDLKGTGTIIGHSNWITFYNLTCGYPTKTTSINLGADWKGIDIYNALIVGTGALSQAVTNQKVLLYGATVANGGTIDVEEFECGTGTSSINGGNYADSWMQVGSGGILNLTGSVTASGNWRVGYYNDNTTNVLNLNGFNIVSSGYFDVGAFSGTNIVGQLTCGAGSIQVASDMHIYSHQNGADTSSAHLGSGTHTIPNELHVTGTNASLTLSSATTTVGGNFTNEGTINANGGTVEFNDNAKTTTISGSTTFYNLTCTTAAKTLLFNVEKDPPANYNTHITHKLTLTGSSGTSNYIVLSRSAEGAGEEEWVIHPAGSKDPLPGEPGWTVNYVTVSYSRNDNDAPILPSDYTDPVPNSTSNWFAGVTLVNLISFDAIGYFGKVKLFWVTGSELDNLGFNILRSEDGKNYIKINPELIKGLGTPVRGQEYTYEDAGVVDGKTYYYLLEDIETTGKITRHGPVVAHPGRDSDSDGMTDDWEYHYGLNPLVNDANVDSDDDGLTNLEEFAAGTNPLVIDSQDAVGASETGGVKVIESAGLRTVLELDTTTLKVTNKNVDGVIYHVITLPEYTHGQTTDVGKPQIPTKGILLGALSKKLVTINILESEKETYPGYNIYPVPKAALTEDPNDPAIKRLTYEFYKDTNAYSIDAFYPGVLAEVDYSNYLQDQQVIKVIFYPIQFNPVKGTLEFYKKIKLEVLQEGADLTATASTVTPKTAVPLTAENAYKIYINENGIYRLTESYLESQEISLSDVDPRKLSVYNQGAEIPIYVFGEEDGKFDESDYVEFYAQAMDTRYTGTNVYWLVLSDSSGLRMALSAQDESATTTPGSFLETRRKEDTTLYWMEAVGEDRWFTDSIYGSQIYDLTLDLDGLANASDEATVKIALEGSVYSGEAFTHHLYARLNGYPIADVSWQGAEEYIINSKISQSYLNEGANTVTLEVGEDPTGYEEILVNWVEVSYLRNFTAKDNALAFGNYTGGAYKYQISGFTDQDVEIYDITDPKGVQRITQFTVLPEGDTFTASFKDIGSKEYVVLTQDKAKLPSGILRDEPSDLADKENKADYIIITHPDFYDTVLPFAEYRSAQGLKVKVVKLDDIYDEFNYGIADVNAVKDFLKYAYNNWTGPKPTYVLLVGDASYDYRDYSGYGFTNYVPTYLVKSLTFGETGSDSWFVCLDGENDVIPDMLIGRFPVKTTDELKSMIDKIIAYEAISPDEAWTKKMLLVADNDEKIFADTSEELASYLTEGYTADKQYLGTTTNNPATLKQNIINSINEGRLFVNYAGHGGIGLWANERIFTWDDINSLYNQHTLPIFTTLTCADGYFVYPRYIESLGERLINDANGGAIATFVPSGISYPTTQAYLAQGFYGAYFKDNDAILGSMVARGKLSVYENESGGDAVNVIQTFNLFGDPALRVRMKAPQIPAVAAPEVFNLEKGKVNEIFKLTKEPKAVESTESTESAGNSTVIVDKGKDSKRGLIKIIRVEEEAAPASPSATKDSLEDKVVKNKELGIEDIQLEDKTVALAPPKWRVLSKSTAESLQVVKPSVKIDYGAVEENVTNISKDAKQLAELRAKFDEAIKASDLQKAKSILRQISKLARKIYWRTF